jgi:hypothetical protein
MPGSPTSPSVLRRRHRAAHRPVQRPPAAQSAAGASNHGPVFGSSGRIPCPAPLVLSAVIPRRGRQDVPGRNVPRRWVMMRRRHHVPRRCMIMVMIERLSVRRSGQEEERQGKFAEKFHAHRVAVRPVESRAGPQRRLAAAYAWPGSSSPRPIDGASRQPRKRAAARDPHHADPAFLNIGVALVQSAQVLLR